MWKGTQFKRKAPGNITASVVQRAINAIIITDSRCGTVESVRYPYRLWRLVTSLNEESINPRDVNC